MLNVYQDWVASSSVQLHVFRKRIDRKEAPYELSENYPFIQLYDNDEFSYEELHVEISKIQPSAIICSGWSNKKYLKIIRETRQRIPTTLTMDTPWNGTLRQYVGLIYSRFFLMPYFRYVWLPGKPQFEYALKLGFNKDQINTGYYVANSKLFTPTLFNKNIAFPRRFIFVGRYIERKGINELWDAFMEFDKENDSDWELLCIGMGPLYSKRPNYPKIKHLGFLQPSILGKFLVEEGGVFILPSYFEPWGLVVHEFSMLGSPLILSEEVGARTQFLTAANGFLLKEPLKENMKKIFYKVDKLSDKELWDMAKESHKLSKSLSETTWINTANKLTN